MISLRKFLRVNWFFQMLGMMILLAIIFVALGGVVGHILDGVNPVMMVVLSLGTVLLGLYLGIALIDNKSGVKVGRFPLFRSILLLLVFVALWWLLAANRGESVLRTVGAVIAYGGCLAIGFTCGFLSGPVTEDKSQA